jgi:predicted nucleic acid-binding Zn ribbon protein
MKKTKRKIGTKIPSKGGKRVCVVCQKERVGAQIKEDFVIRGIRRIKQMFKATTGNKLVVCGECKEIAKKKRQTFEKTLLTYLGLGGIILLIMLVLALISGGPIMSILQSVVVLLFFVILLAALSLLNYFPSFEGYEASKKKTIKR